MLTLAEDLGLLMRLATRLEPRVLSFELGHHLSRWLRPPPRADGLLPTALYVETSSFCLGHCRGCYVPAADRCRQLLLGEEGLRAAVEAARRLRVDYVCIVGGEPLDEAIVETNLALVRSAPDVRFLLCTGGYGRCDEGLLEQLARLPNLSLVFSFDGPSATHDRIRGEGSHARTLRTMAAYGGPGRRLCGASVTLRGENCEDATSPAFVQSLVSAGCNYFVFDTCFAAGAAEAVTADALAGAIGRLRALAAGTPAGFFVNPFGRLLGSGFCASSGMVAATVDYRGNVYGSRRGEPLGNVHTGSLLAILQSEAFGGAATDDPRAGLFERTLERLSQTA